MLVTGMSSSEPRREVSCPVYMPMTSPDGSHQRHAAAVPSSRHRRPCSTDFRMIPSQADCQVKPATSLVCSSTQ